MYQLTQNSNILRNSDGALIPADPNNADYQAYQGWVAAGNTPDPAPIPNPLPSFIASVQAALATSDETLKRVQEAISLGTNSATSADVVAFVNYRRALRALLSASTVLTLPTKPPFPAGT